MEALQAGGAIAMKPRKAPALASAPIVQARRSSERRRTAAQPLIATRATNETPV